MSFQDRILRFLYKTALGRRILVRLVNPKLSRCIGRFLDTRISALLIPGFIKSNHIDMTQYEQVSYDSFNDFFTRKIRKECRPVAQENEALIAPCDSRLSVYPIDQDSEFEVKGTRYTLKSLFRSNKLAEKYEGGVFLLFRLGVDDYHRYCYIDDGVKTRNYHIPGVLHTVNPIANEVYPIYKENTREFSLLRSKHFGTVLMMEVGAMLVGRIVNHQEAGEVVRAEEKGLFEYGGSTVILCFQKDKVSIDPLYYRNSENQIETKVEIGQKIGNSL